jgi:SAM-dependent methyltransferase
MDLSTFNAKWTRRFAEFANCSPTPLWAPGLAPTPESRYWHERYLPVREYCRGLASLLRPALPHPDWGPTCLRNPRFLAITDFWRDLPPAFAGRLTWQANELLSLGCALASPPRFGTAANRYPEQLCELRNFLATRKQASLLDLGCGTGDGTAEMAALGFAPCVGVTLEPLEAWMAHQRFPQIDFQACDILELELPTRFDLIVCNGLLGGPLLHKPAEFASLLDRLKPLLAPGGRLAIADRFHGGHRAARERFLAMAAERLSPGSVLRQR